MNKTLEQEFKERQFMHKATLIRGFLTKMYIDTEESRGVIQLSFPCLMEQAEDFADKVIAKAIFVEEFDNLYNAIWDKVADIIPDSFSITAQEQETRKYF